MYFWGRPITKAAQERLEKEVLAMPGINRAKVKKWDPDQIEIQGVVPPIGKEVTVYIQAVFIDGERKARVFRRIAGVTVRSWTGNGRDPHPDDIEFDPRLQPSIDPRMARYFIAVSDDPYATVVVTLCNEDEVYRHPLSRRPYDCEGCSVARDIWGDDQETGRMGDE